MTGAKQELNDATELAGRSDCIFLATVDKNGLPSLTPVEHCRPANEDRVFVNAWMQNPPLATGAGNIALLIWDTQQERGFQLTGRAVHTDEAAVLDGYAQVESREQFAQVEREILIEIDSVTALRTRSKGQVRQ